MALIQFYIRRSMFTISANLKMKVDIILVSQSIKFGKGHVHFPDHIGKPSGQPGRCACAHLGLG